MKGLNWFSHYWKHVLFLILIITGGVAMAFFKLQAVEDTFVNISIVLVIEFSVGVAMFGRAILRQTDQRGARIGFRWSIIFRVLLALIGVLVFVEVSPRVDSVFPYVHPDPKGITWTGLFIYITGNFALLLCEWMFARLLSSPPRWKELKDVLISIGVITPDYPDFNKTDIEKALEQIIHIFKDQRGKLNLKSEEIQGFKDDLQHIGKYLFRYGYTPDYSEGTPNEAELPADKREWTLNDLFEVLKAQRVAMTTSESVLKDIEKDLLKFGWVESSNGYFSGGLRDQIKYVSNVILKRHEFEKKYQGGDEQKSRLIDDQKKQIKNAERTIQEQNKLILGFAGKLYQAGNNIQGWICPECLEENTKGRKASQTCKNCGHTVDKNILNSFE